MPDHCSLETRAAASDPFAGRLAFVSLPDPKQALAVFLTVSLTFSTLGLDGCKKEQPQSQQAQQAQGQAPPTTYATPTADQLYQLVAPIALFPDNLVALALAGSTYPDQISAAQQWLQQNSSLKGQQLMETVNQQSWDNSVKGLTQFPDVLGQMSSNLSWTSALGDAYFNVPQSVMNAVQVMRQRAYQAGNLKNTPQQNVSVQNEAPGTAPPPEASSGAPQTTIVQPPPQTIVIQPAQPEVVYVPTYNPTVVYGAPVPVYPGYVAPTYSTGAMVATGLISFGVGMAIGASMNNGCCGWGYNSWGCGWHNSSVTYNRNVYVSNSNTFVNRNNYYNRNNINTANINNVNRNNINNVNRNNVNNNYRANNFDSNARNSNFTEPKFNQDRNQSQFQNNKGNLAQNNNRQNLAQNNNRGNLAQNNRQQAGGPNQPNFNQQNRAGANQQNRPGAAQNQNRPANQPQRDASRGYGQQPSRGASDNAFGNYSQGGNARTNSARGEQSLQGNRTQPSGGGANRPQTAGANRGGGGASRPQQQPQSRPQGQARQGGGRPR